MIENMTAMDMRYGRDIGLTGDLAALRGFEIINRARAAALNLVSAMTVLRGADHNVKTSPEWAALYARRSELVNYFYYGMPATGEAAAKLIADIKAFRETELEPFIATVKPKQAA